MNLASEATIMGVFSFYLLLIWSLVWKGIALWKSANDKQKNWFIAILVLNTIGVVEIIYLFRFAKNKLVVDDLKFWKYINIKKKQSKR